MYLLRVLSFIWKIEVQCVSFSSNVWVGGDGWVGVWGDGLGCVRGELPAGGIRASQGTFSSLPYEY